MAPPQRAPAIQPNLAVNLNNRLTSNGNGNGLTGGLDVINVNKPNGFRNQKAFNNNFLNNNGNSNNIIKNINDLPFTNLVGIQFPNVAPKPFSQPQLSNGRSYLPPINQAQKPLPNPRGYLPPKGYLPPQRY